MYRFLLTRKWLGLALVVLLLVPTFLLLARWQWHRHLSRAAYNTAVSGHQAQPTVPLDSLLTATVLADPVPPLPQALVWRNVTVSGSYLPIQRQYVRRQTLNMSDGFWVIAPFKADSGAVLAVNRGWVPATGGPTTSPQVPAPPTGHVTITGRLRSSGWIVGDIPADLPADQTTTLDVARVVPSGSSGYPAYLELASSTPPDSATLTPIPLPTLDAGPHLGYMLEWIAFAILAVVGYGILARREAQERRTGSAQPEPALDGAG